MTTLKDHHSLNFFLFLSLIPMIIKFHEYTVYNIIINLLPLCSLLGGGRVRSLFVLLLWHHHHWYVSMVNDIVTDTS